jgi:hypothetical protein
LLPLSVEAADLDLGQLCADLVETAVERVESAN